jgi:hypothetical protein
VAGNVVFSSGGAFGEGIQDQGPKHRSHRTPSQAAAEGALRRGVGSEAARWKVYWRSARPPSPPHAQPSILTERRLDDLRLRRSQSDVRRRRHAGARCVERRRLRWRAWRCERREGRAAGRRSGWKLPGCGTRRRNDLSGRSPLRGGDRRRVHQEQVHLGVLLAGRVLCLG